MSTYVVLMNLTEQGIKDIKGAPERLGNVTKPVFDIEQMVA